MFNGDTSSLITPSNNEITTTNITSQDIVVKELGSDDNKETSEQQHKRVKIEQS